MVDVRTGIANWSEVVLKMFTCFNADFPLAFRLNALVPDL